MTTISPERPAEPGEDGHASGAAGHLDEGRAFMFTGCVPVRICLVRAHRRTTSRPRVTFDRHPVFDRRTSEGASR